MVNSNLNDEQPTIHILDEQELDSFAETLERLTSCECPTCGNFRRWLCHPDRSKRLSKLQHQLLQLKKTALARFSDNPFRPPQTSLPNKWRASRSVTRLYASTGRQETKGQQSKEGYSLSLRLRTRGREGCYLAIRSAYLSRRPFSPTYHVAHLIYSVHRAVIVPARKLRNVPA